MIQRGLSVRIERRVHAGLNIDAAFELGSERLVVFGPSGSGKSTLLRAIAGLEPIDAGRIELGGRILFDDRAGTNLPPRSRRIGMIFQDDRLFPHLDVRANVGFGLRSRPGAERESRVLELAELCGFEHLLNRRPDALSGGERQRVGLARAVAPRPDLLLCDEPVSALDLAARYRLIEQVKRIQESESIPLVFVTHSPGEALAIGERLIAWRDGRIEADGPPIDVLAGHPLGRGFENVWPARLLSSETHESTIRLEGGPVLAVSRVDLPIGSRLTARLRADEIVIAVGIATGAGAALSARNVLEGSVDRVTIDGHEARVVVRIGETRWVAAVTAGSADSLGLTPGSDVSLVVKATGVQCS